MSFFGSLVELVDVDLRSSLDLTIEGVSVLSKGSSVKKLVVGNIFLRFLLIRFLRISSCFLGRLILTKAIHSMSYGSFVLLISRSIVGGEKRISVSGGGWPLHQRSNISSIDVIHSIRVSEIFSVFLVEHAQSL